MIIDLINFIPKKLDHREVFVNKQKNYLIIKCNKKRPPKPLKLKAKIKIDDSFLEVIGLYFGDGTKSRKGSGNRKVTFNNTDPILHKHWVKFLENLGVTKDQLYVQIDKGRNVNLSDSTLINYWSNKMDISKERFCKGLGVKKVNGVKYGLLIINYHNKLFRVIFDNLFEFSLGLCKTHKKFAVAFIRGIFAAEGHVNSNRYGSLNVLEIPVKSLKRRRFVKRLLDHLEIKASDHYERLRIFGFLNFRLANKLNLASIHPKKNKNFNKGFEHLIKYGNVKALTKLKIIDTLKDGPKTRYKISENINCSISVIHKALRDLEIKRIVKRVEKEKLVRDVWALDNLPKNLSLLIKRDY